MGTIRQMMLSLLEQQQMSAKDLSQELGIREKEVYDHLKHLEQSLKRQNRKLMIAPYQCLKCGFVFRKRDRLTPPGRCPRCREGYIQAAIYHVEQIEDASLE